jgi:hypothetical protein
MKHSALGTLDARTYVPHALHLAERDWPETNCYADLWIEVLHALGHEPAASLAYTMAVDFEGDQWTFFKPSHAELHALYQVDVQELTIWRPLEHHALEQLKRGRLVLAETDAFVLPDTRGTDYQHQHTKTTVGIESMDPEACVLGYFHNTGYFELSGDDYRALFPVEPAHQPLLPTYVEFVKVLDGPAFDGRALVQRSIDHLRGHLRRAPKNNPIKPFGARFSDQIVQLRDGDLRSYHAYAFATLRQLGGAFELASRYVRWLETNGQRDLEEPARAFNAISSTAKAMILKAARAVATKKNVDFTPMLDDMAASWEAGVQAMRRQYLT